MKKISTLAFMAIFCCLSSMAQVVLGDINFSLGEGKKINPKTGVISITFPNVSGVEDPTAVQFEIAGSFDEDNDFDELFGTFSKGITLKLKDFDLEPSTDYTLKITSVKVDGTELAPAEGYTLNFKTRGAERKMSWTFLMDEKSSAQIVAEGSANVAGSETEDGTKYMDIQKNGASTNRFYVPARNYDEIVLPDGTALPMTEDLLFKFGKKTFYVGQYNTGSYKDVICFNGNNQYLTIPDCKEGDVITFNCKYATKPTNKAFPIIKAMNGAAIAVDGLVSSSGLQDSIDVPKNYSNLKFEVLVDGDLTLNIGQCTMKSITIEEGQEKLPRNYNIVAKYVDEENEIVLKELVAKTLGTTGSTIKVNYPYWLTDEEGNAYTHGTKGSEFVEAFDLKNGEGDTTFVINYAKTDYTGVVYLTEGEDIAGAFLCTNGNAAIRSSMGKSGYVTEDTKLVTLQPGSYKIRAVVFDAGKTPSYVCTLAVGDNEDNELFFSATATNWTETESDLITLTEPTDITLKAGGGDDKGLDCLIIYASEDAPDDDPTGITEVNAVKKASVRKVLSKGRILLKGEAGIFNAIGIEVK